MRSAQTLDGLLTPVAMLFEVLGEAQPFELELGLAGEAVAGSTASGEHQYLPYNRPLWRQNFHDTLKAAGQTAQAAGFKSVGHLAALLGPYLRQSASPRDLAEAHNLTAALFSFLAGDLPGDEAHCLLGIVSQWVSPLTPLPEVVKRLVAECLASDGLVLHRSRLQRLESDAPLWNVTAAGNQPALLHALSPGPDRSDEALASATQSFAGVGVTVARDELTMVAGAWLELAQLLGVVSNPGSLAGGTEGVSPAGSNLVSARVWSEAAEQLENLANALAYMGLDATSAMLQLHVFLFTSLGQNGEAGQAALARSLRFWVALWAQAFRRQDAGDFRRALALSGQILDAAQRSAPSMIEDSQHEMLNLKVIESRQVALRQLPSGPEMSLVPSADCDPAVIAEMLAELPVLSLAYGDSLRAALDGTQGALDEACRHAHSLKGLALTAGIAGLANYTHSLEDLLLLLDSDPGNSPAALKSLLTESANLLVVLTDTVARGMPAPGGFMAVQARVIEAVNERVQRRSGLAQPPVLQSETDMLPAAAVSLDGLFGAGADEAANTAKAVSAKGAQARKADNAWQTRVTQDAAQALEFAQLLGQVAKLQDLAEGANSLSVLQVQMGQGLARLREHLRQLQHLQDPETDNVLEIEQQAISSLLPRLSQVVLQAGRLAGKSAALRLEGGQTLLDTVLLQQLTDPLSHLLRNAVDHGIEAAEERVRLGKTATGQLRLACTRQGDDLELVLHDDGRGLDLEKIRDKAVAMGLVSAAEAVDCTDEQISQWIFSAGLSTKAQVGVLSGRGVGMDVVRQVFDRLHGELMLETEQGQGTSVHMRLPLLPKARIPSPL